MALKPNITTVAVATAGVRVQASSTNLYCEWVRFESVAGTIYVGASDVASTKYMTKLAAGVGYDLKNPGQTNHAGDKQSFNLKNFWFDSAGSGDKCQMTYFTRIGED